MTATLLCCDAWLDMLSSVGQGRSATVAAIGEAAFAELPLAALFAWVAARFTRTVAEARPSLQRAGFRIRHRRLVPPAGNYPALLDDALLVLAIVLAASAVALLRRWPVAEVLVSVAAALLLRDAWFNVLTAKRGHSAVALGVAAGLEPPLAGLCRGLPSCTRRRSRSPGPTYAHCAWKLPASRPQASRE